MMRMLFPALALFAASCSGGEFAEPPDEWQEEAGPEGTEVVIDHELLFIPTSELGTERTRPIAKTIEWVAMGTEQGTTYIGGKVVVDRILRDDADNRYAVRVRLKNTGKEMLKLACLIRFYNRQGGQISGYVGSIGAAERWQGLILEPYGVATLSDFARVTGADGFKLHVRAAGATGDGSPDVKAQPPE